MEKLEQMILKDMKIEGKILVTLAIISLLLCLYFALN